MNRVKNFITDLAVCSLPMWCVLAMIIHWFSFGY